MTVIRDWPRDRSIEEHLAVELGRQAREMPATRQAAAAAAVMRVIDEHIGACCCPRATCRSRTT